MNLRAQMPLNHKPTPQINHNCVCAVLHFPSVVMQSSGVSLACTSTLICTGEPLLPYGDDRIPTEAIKADAYYLTLRSPKVQVTERHT